MAGHSKWANTKHRKARADAAKGKIFTKVAREISVAAKEGGDDIDTNFRLRMAIQKAKDNNMPNDNIQRAIQKGIGGQDGASFEQAVLEGYAADGVAILLEVMTDNHNRTVAEIRHLFSRNNGNLGESGCVAWIFSRKGLVRVNQKDSGLDEDDLMLAALEAGAEDADLDDSGTFNIITEIDQLQAVKDKIQQQGITVDSYEVTMLPSNTLNITDAGTAGKIIKLMEALDDHDDVQNVYANFDIPEELMAETQ
ncbi:MAG: YebC/PmpR family DNA-binding transcriptional regulator [Bacillota bacterium]